MQQDIFLPFVESGTITLIGATTGIVTLFLFILIIIPENPSFEVNSALLSRCKVFVLQKLQPPAIKQIIKNGIEKYNTTDWGQNPKRLVVEDDVLNIVSESADGDARAALNMLDRTYHYNRCHTYIKHSCG